jgi:signal-transduction protein with cAMP-binding, CBS, and nucleotidyltransferase domain
MVLVAKDIVEKDFLSLARNTTALDAARQMKSKRQGFAIIASPTGSPEGIVTEWDYLSNIVAEGKDPSHVKLGDIMTSELVSVDASVGLDQVAELMARKGIRRVLVLKDRKVIGVITAGSMLSRLKEYVDQVSSTIARLQSPMM